MAEVTIHSNATSVVFNEIGGFKNFGNTPVTVEEAIQKSGADFTVRKDHLIRVNEDDWENLVQGDFSSLTLDRTHLIENHCATVRTDNGRNLGIVGKDYGVIQNSKAFEFVDYIINGNKDGNTPIITSCGTLNEGRQMYVSAKIPNNIRIGNSEIDDYILFTNSHDGTYSIQVLFTPVRVVCQNTLNLALSTAKNKLVYKHTRFAESRLDLQKQENLEKAKEVLCMHEHFTAEFIDALNDLANQQIKGDDMMRFVTSLYLTPAQIAEVEKQHYQVEGVESISTRTKNNIYAVANSIESGIGQDINRGSKLWLLNGFTTYLSNEKKWKSGNDKFNSIFGGTANRKTQDAYAVLKAM